MNKTIGKVFIVFFIGITLFSTPSCVSKKKYLREVSNRTVCDSTLQMINTRNLSLNGEIATLKLQLAEKTGERNALRDLHDKQNQQIDRLEQELRKLTNQSQNRQQTLDVTLQQKERELDAQKAAIQNFKKAILSQEESLKELIDKVTINLSSYSSEELSMEVKNGLGYISISEQVLFRRGSTRTTSKAYDILESIARVLLEYPQMDIYVLGHTDNQPVRNRDLADNWDLSVLRSTPVVRMLTKEFGLNPNQVTAGGKGDSKPKSSNDTAEGREQNRRTEIVIYPPTDNILKMILDHE